MRIGIDLDGVMCQFTRAFVDVVNDLWPCRLQPGTVNQKWDWSDLGLSHREVSKAWREIKARANFWMTLRAYPESVRAVSIHRILFPHDEIFYVTARTSTLGLPPLHQSQRWLDSCGISGTGTNVIVVPADDKLAAYKALDIDIGLDDYLQTAATSGGLIHLLDRPWNREGRINGINIAASIENFFRLLERDREAARPSGAGKGLQ